MGVNKDVRVLAVAITVCQMCQWFGILSRFVSVVLTRLVKRECTSASTCEAVPLGGLHGLARMCGCSGVVSHG